MNGDDGIMREVGGSAKDEATPTCAKFTHTTAVNIKYISKHTGRVGKVLVFRKKDGRGRTVYGRVCVEDERNIERIRCRDGRERNPTTNRNCLRVCEFRKRAQRTRRDTAVMGKRAEETALVGYGMPCSVLWRAHADAC